MNAQYYLSRLNILRGRNNLYPVSIDDEEFTDFMADVVECELAVFNQSRHIQGLYQPLTSQDQQFQTYFDELSTSNRLKMVCFDSLSINDRRTKVIEMHRVGATITAISRSLGVCRKTITRDFNYLGLKTWTDISDHDLQVEVQSIIQRATNYIGRRSIEGSLLLVGIRTTRLRILSTMKSLGHTRPMIVPRPRRLWYEAMGPNGVWAMDQNEKIGMYGFKFLAIIDGFSRFPIHWKMVSDLTGHTHSLFYAEAVSLTGGVPVITCVDGAAAWNGVREQVRSVHDITIPAIVPIGTSTISLLPFNPTKSVWNTPVERHWRDVNNVTRKYKEEFQRLEGLGYLDKTNPGHLFSLILVYQEAICSDIDEHYEAMKLRKKEKSTKNPNYPEGTFRRVQLYQQFPSYLRQCSQQEIQNIRDIGCDYWRNRSEMPAWQTDPLSGDEDVQCRENVMIRMRCLPLHEQFVAHSSITSFLGDPQNNNTYAQHHALSNILRLRSVISNSQVP